MHNCDDQSINIYSVICELALALLTKFWPPFANKNGQVMCEVAIIFGRFSFVNLLKPCVATFGGLFHSKRFTYCHCDLEQFSTECRKPEIKVITF